MLLFAFSACIPPLNSQDYYFRVVYAAGEGGHIEGLTEQTVEYGKDATSVTAVASEGYKFEKWSDGLTSSTRQDRNVQSDILVVAFFTSLRDLSRVTFEVDYNLGVADNPVESVTFVRDNVAATVLPVPTREHFTFGGWYVGKTQVSDEQGEILVGNEIIDSDEAVIRAKWIADETFTYKVLIVYVTRVQARLQDYEYNWVDVDYTMSVEEEQFFHATTPYVKMYLDEMMDGMVEFQVDEYFTTEALTAESFHMMAGHFAGHRGLGLWAYNIPELAQSNLLEEYDSVIVSCGLEPGAPGGDRFNDGISGTAYSKYAQIMFDRCWRSMNLNGVTFASGTECMQNFEKSDTNYTAYILEDYWVDTFIHELAHTIELRVKMDTLDEICYRSDTVVNYGNWARIMKEFYFHQALLFGEKVGIPYDIWAGNIAKITIDRLSIVGEGSIKIPGHPMTYDTRSGGLDYTEAIIGDEITLNAKPSNAYKFGRWSDGDTNATRTFTVTEDVTLSATFEAIDYTLTVIAGEGGSLAYLNEPTVLFDSATAVLQRWNGELVLDAVPQDGYRFVGWSDGSTATRRWFDLISSSALIDLADENNCITVTAIFEKIEE